MWFYFYGFEIEQFFYTSITRSSKNFCNLYVQLEESNTHSAHRLHLLRKMSSLHKFVDSPLSVTVVLKN